MYRRPALIMVLIIALVAALATYVVTRRQPQKERVVSTKILSQDHGGGIGLDKYPLLPKKMPMTDRQIERLGLKRFRLDKPTAVFNHYRELGRTGAWKYEVLPAGTEVAGDRNRAWYKTDCANRLFVPSCPICPSAGGTLGLGSGNGGFPWRWLWLIPLVIGVALGLWGLARRHRSSVRPDPQRGDREAGAFRHRQTIGGEREWAGAEGDLFEPGLVDRVTWLEKGLRRVSDELGEIHSDTVSTRDAVSQLQADFSGLSGRMEDAIRAAAVGSGRADPPPRPAVPSVPASVDSLAAIRAQLAAAEEREDHTTAATLRQTIEMLEGNSAA